MKRLFVGILVIVLFVCLVQLLTQAPTPYRQIREAGIEADALFYSESEAALEANYEMLKRRK